MSRRTKAPTMSAATAEATRRRGRVEAPRYSVRYGPGGRELVASSGGHRAARALSATGYSVPTTRNNADSRTRQTLANMRAISQDFDTNNAIAQAIVSRWLDVILGEGSTLQVQSGDPALNAKVEALWETWAASPEIRGMDDWGGFERKLLRHYAIDGDVLIARTDKRRLQLFTADQIDDTAGISKTDDGRVREQGIELDENRMPVAYWVTPFTEWGIPDYAKAKRIPAAAASFVANRRRMDQTRGEPLLLPAFPMLHRVNDVCDSEAAAWQLLSRLALSVTRSGAAKLAHGTSMSDPNPVAAAEAELASRVHEFDTAIIFHGEPGDEVKGIERNIPGANFVESLKMMLRIIGMPLGFSLEFTLLIWSDTNYSSGRASAKQVERNTAAVRRQLRRIYSEIYRWLLGLLVSDKLLTAAEAAAAQKHEFHFPPYPFIDPEKERAAQSEAIRTGLSSMTREAKAQGDDYPDLLAETEAEMLAAQEAAERMNKRFPTMGVSWRDFRPLSEGGQSALAQASAMPATEGGQQNAPI